MASFPERSRQKEQPSFDQNRRGKKKKDKRPDKTNNKKHTNGKAKNGKRKRKKKTAAQRAQFVEAKAVPQQSVDDFDRNSVSTSTSPTSDEQKEDGDFLDLGGLGISLLELDSPKIFKSTQNEDMVWRSVGGKRKKASDFKTEKKARISWPQEPPPNEREQRQDQQVSSSSYSEGYDHDILTKRQETAVRARRPVSRASRGSGGRTRPPLPHKRKPFPPPLDFRRGENKNNNPHFGRRKVGYSDHPRSSEYRVYRPKQHGDDRSHSNRQERSSSPRNANSHRHNRRHHDRSQSRSSSCEHRGHRAHREESSSPSFPEETSSSSSSRRQFLPYTPSPDPVSATPPPDSMSNSDRPEQPEESRGDASHVTEDSAATQASSSSVSPDDEGEEDNRAPPTTTPEESLPDKDAALTTVFPADDAISTTHQSDQIGEPESPQEPDKSLHNTQDDDTTTDNHRACSSTPTLDTTNKERSSSAKPKISVPVVTKVSKDRDKNKRISSIMCPSPSASPSTSPCVSPDIGSQPSFRGYPAFMMEPPAYRHPHSHTQRWSGYGYNSQFCPGTYYPHQVRNAVPYYYAAEEQPRRRRTFSFRHVLNDTENKCVARYCPSVFEPQLLKKWYETIYDRAEWSEHETFNPRFNNHVPRLVAWYTDHPCTCHYSYSGVDCPPNPTPDWLQQIQRMVFDSARISVADFPDSCNINLYRNGLDCAGWHQDDEELFDSLENQCLIVSFSLGVSRFFEFRKLYDTRPDQMYRQLLNDGDILTMEGYFQRYYQHRVPADDNGDSRINLTWRWIQKHSHTCPKQRE